MIWGFHASTVKNLSSYFLGIFRDQILDSEQFLPQMESGLQYVILVLIFAPKFVSSNQKWIMGSSFTSEWPLLGMRAHF